MLKFCNICIIFAEFSQKLLIFQTDFCEKFEIAAVQKDANLVELEKCCQTHILLQNFVLIQPRTSPPKICNILQNPVLLVVNPANFSERHALVVFPRGWFDPYRLHPAARLLRAWVQRGSRRRRGQRASVGKFSAKCCSFSAVSAPIFARKYAFCSIFQNLQDSQAEFFEI